MSFPQRNTPAPAQHAPPVGPSPVYVHPLKRRTTLAAVAGLCAVLVAAAGIAFYLIRRPGSAAPAVATASASTATFTAGGQVHLKRGEFSWNSAADPACAGLNGYADLKGGATVTVTDASGKKLAIGVLASGITGDFSTAEDGTQRAGSCALSFAVPGIPRGAGPYGIEVSHRGVQNYDERRLDGGVILELN